MTPRWTVSSRCNGERWEAISPECQTGTDDRHTRCGWFRTQGEALAWVGARAAEDAVVLPVPLEVP